VHYRDSSIPGGIKELRGNKLGSPQESPIIYEILSVQLLATPRMHKIATIGIAE
jgi:hypothetical protein